MAGRGDTDNDPIQPGMSVTVVVTDDVVTKINLSEQEELVGCQTMTVNQVDLIDGMFIEGYLANDNQLVRLTVDHDASIIEPDGTMVLVAPRDTHIESAKLWQRALINFAGPLNNFILTLILFIGLAFSLPGVSTTTVDQVNKDSPAALAGLKHNDEITAINGERIHSWQKMQNTIQPLANQKVNITYERNGKAHHVTLKPKGVKNGGMVIGQVGVTSKQTNALTARIRYGFQMTSQSMTQIFRAIKNLVQGFSLNKLGGPVAIYKNTSEVSHMGILAIVSFMAWLSVNLGMMNLLPIPGLDGGKLLLNAVEAIIRRPVPEKAELAVTLVGVGLLFVLMIAVTGNDILRYFIK
jgi:regulator of sigma E protease